MNGKVFYFIVLQFFATAAMLLVPGRCRAQYDDIRFPQTPDEIALYKKNKVMGEVQWSIEQGKRLSYASRAFDTAGRIVIDVNYYHRRYYVYDAKGNVTAYLDSARSDTGYKANIYHLKYYDNGMLQEVTGPGVKSTFTYDQEKRWLNEKLVKHDTMSRCVYRYDKDGRIKDARSFAPFTGKLLQHITKNYAADGRIYNETVAQFYPASTDSMITIYEYNDKKQLSQKQVFRFVTYYFSSNNSGRADHEATHYDVGTFEYNLDDHGRPLAERYSVKDDKLSYSYSTWLYDSNGLITKDTYAFGKGDARVLEHQYFYYTR